MRSHNHRRGGFTLVEILVVVVILGIAAAMVIPQIGSRDDLNTAASARVVMADLIYAQNLAVMKQQWHFVRFGEQNYQINSRATGQTQLMDVSNPLQKTTGFLVTFGQQSNPAFRHVRLVKAVFGGQPNLAFDEMGTPHAWDVQTNTLTALTEPGEITLASGSYQMKILVEPFTGQIAIE
jgi:type II secretion system protein H